MAGIKSIQVPDELVELIAERRVIPFVGSGFSACLGVPTWDELLAKVSAKIEGALPYEEIRAYTNGDPLQAAEYLFLKSYRRMGPIRHAIEQSLQSGTAPVLSGPHVELVNLGCPQIYTTNYDDYIEDTFRVLDLPVNVITLPRDVATARNDVTQIVKYHGDLRHDDTLVLTESSYYRRLDFESPMDLKFRSDLLGKAVIFMGYSFRDINIRIIWFKLMQMMKDIPEEDRLQSYIVRIDPNPVLQDLDHSVGLKTIVLDEEATANTPELRTARLAEFLNLLGVRASPSSQMPGSNQPMYLSSHVLDRAEREMAAEGGAASRRVMLGIGRPSASMGLLVSRRLPRQLFKKARPVFEMALSGGSPGVFARYQAYYGSSEMLTFSVCQALCASFTRSNLLADSTIDWSAIWSCGLSEEHGQLIVSRLTNEIGYHRGGHRDRDLAFTVDIVSRMLSGELGTFSKETTDLAESCLIEASDMYPSISEYRPLSGTAPTVDAILAEIDVASDGDSEPF